MKKGIKITSAIMALILILSSVMIFPASAAETGEDNCLIGASNSYTMHTGQSMYMYMELKYTNVFYENITTSNPDIVDVKGDRKGGMNIYAKKQGTTRVTITVKAYTSAAPYVRTADCFITVVPAPSAPANVRIRNYETGFNINWDKAPNAQRYVVYIKTKSSEWLYDLTYHNYMNIEDLEPGEMYYVQVQSLGLNDFTGGFSRVSSYTFVPRTYHTCKYNTNGSVTLNWLEAENVQGYAIAKKKAGDKNYTYYYTKSTSFNDKNVAAGEVYYYQVSPYYTVGKSTAYGQWSDTKKVTTLFKPTVTNMNSNASRLNINWNSIKGATAYKVAFKRTTDSAWNYRTTTSRYYNVVNPTKGATYITQVCPVNGSVAGPWSDAASHYID